MTWRVWLIGIPVRLEVLARTAQPKRYAIGRDGDHFYLESQEFDATPDSREVAQLALEHLAVLNAAAMLEWGSSAKADIDYVEECRDPLANIICLDWVEEVETTDTLETTLYDADGSVKCS